MMELKKTGKQNILIVHNYYQIPGGEDTVVNNEKKMLEKHGHKVVLYTRCNSELKQISMLHKVLLPLATIFNPRTYREIRYLIKTENIEIVHVHNTLFLISPAIYYAALSCKVPVVQTIHNFRLLCPGATFYRDKQICEDCIERGIRSSIKYGCYRGSRGQTFLCVLKETLHRFTGIYKKINYICLTEFNKKKLMKLKQIKSEQLFVKPNFTNPLPLNKKEGKFYLYIGRIEEIKGIPLLLEAFSKMPEHKLVLAGSGMELEKYRNAVVQNNISNIKFKGFIKHDDLTHLLESAKAVVVTSQWYETFGMVVIEAFAANTPVIAGDIGNIGSLVDDGVNGVKFQHNSVDSFIAAVERLEHMDLELLGKNAYRKYEEQFSEEVNYAVIEKIYSNITRGGILENFYIPLHLDLRTDRLQIFIQYAATPRKGRWQHEYDKKIETDALPTIACQAEKYIFRKDKYLRTGNCILCPKSNEYW